MIQATVRDRNLSIWSAYPITSGSVGIKMEVWFDSAWNGLLKYCVFSGSGKKITVQYYDSQISVPHEVLTEGGGRLQIGVYGTNLSGDIIIPTIWNHDTIIYEGATISDDPGVTPTPTVVAQMESSIETATATANTAKRISEESAATVDSAMAYLYEHGMPSGDVPIVHTFNGRSGTVSLLASDLLDFVHPIGSYYISSVSTSPAILFGGTWEQVKDTFILAAGDTYTAGDTGGEAVHTLIVDETPAHTHGSKSLTGTSQNVFSGGQSGGTNGIVSHTKVSNRQYNTKDETVNSWQTITVNATHEHDSVGGGQAHNNMPPYIVAYVWKRTA